MPVARPHHAAATGPSVRIATRASALALWQAEHVAALLVAANPGVSVELVPLTTEGDRRLDVPISVIGGKGVFATEVQRALVDGRADVAVHSAKDLTARTPDELLIAAIPQRGDPRDALVGTPLDDLPQGAVVATGSNRRRALLADVRPDLVFADLRGNMATRLDKAKDFDAIVVAGVALVRLGLGDRIDDWLDPTSFVPQVSQAALAVECRADDHEVARLLASIDHPESRRRVEVERSFLTELGGDCSLPAGAHAVLDPAGQVVISGILADTPGGRLVRGQVSSADSDDPGTELARRLRGLLDGGS